MSFRITVNPGTVLSDLARIADGLKTGVKSALDVGGKAGLEHARSVVPVRTGRLRDSIRSEVSESTLTLSANTEYAIAVEFGHHAVPARPYLRPAAEVSIKEIQNALPKGLGLQGGFGAIRTARP